MVRGKQLPATFVKKIYKVNKLWESGSNHSSSCANTFEGNSDVT